MIEQNLPVAVIGAGPVGLAAAAQLVAQGERTIVLEAGDRVGANVLRWGHVRIFSPWRHNIDASARSLLEAAGWEAPDDDALPTGRDLVEQYLEPLAGLPAIAPRIRLGTRVLGVARRDHDKMKTPGRELAPFELRVLGPGEAEEILLARAVIDASGTYQFPNPLGASGRPAAGEDAARDRIFYGIPDVLGDDRARYAGRKVLVVGAGHSAFNVLLDLATLARDVPDTQITWLTRQPPREQAFGGGDGDRLPARGRLGSDVRRLLLEGVVEHATLRIASIRPASGGVMVSDGEANLGPFDEIVAATGFRPDLSMTSELRLALDPVVESPVALAPLIDPNVHSCGTVPPHGAEELQHPERDFYQVGMKSYGRAPTFLMLTGYEQVRSVVAAIRGDWESARRVQLVLPETGVCSSSTAEAGESCCGSSAEVPALVGAASERVVTPLAILEPLRISSLGSSGALTAYEGTGSSSCGG